MMQLPYLLPLDNVNKRVSRLAENLSFIRTNLVPLSFADVPITICMEAVLGVYELNRIDLLKDVFIWVFERSASRYAAVREPLGKPDPFRLKYRDAQRKVVQNIVMEGMDKNSTVSPYRHVGRRAGRSGRTGPMQESC